MAAMIIYIIAVLAFIMSVLFLSLIPNKVARSVILYAYLLLFVGGITFLLYKVSGQSNLMDFFETFSDLS